MDLHGDFHVYDTTLRDGAQQEGLNLSVADKLAILKNLVDRASLICVGGGIANTFLRAQGIDVGASLYEADRIQDAYEVMRLASSRNDLRLLMPTDVVIADAGGERINNVSVNRIPPGFRILDLGRRTLEDMREALAPIEMKKKKKA